MFNRLLARTMIRGISDMLILSSFLVHPFTHDRIASSIEFRFQSYLKKIDLFTFSSVSITCFLRKGAVGELYGNAGQNMLVAVIPLNL